MTLPDIEPVAALVHDQWRQNKKAQGITSRLAENGEELMVPYPQLSEEQKEADRAVVRTVYQAIERAMLGDWPSFSKVREAEKPEAKQE